MGQRQSEARVKSVGEHQAMGTEGGDGGPGGGSFSYR